MQTPPSGSSPTNYPRPNLDVNREVLREVATSQRQIMLCVLGQIVLAVLNGVATASHIFALSIVDLFLGLGLLVFMIISVVKLAKALGESAVLYAILMFVPCVSLVMLLVLSGKATTHLKQAGIKVGLMGADPNSI